MASEGGIFSYVVDGVKTTVKTVVVAVKAVVNFCIEAIRFLLRGTPYNKDELEKEIGSQVKVIYEVSQDNRVKEDNKDVSEMISAAANDDFMTSLRIVKKKRYLVNTMASENPWSVLHHAVYRDREDIIEELQRIPNCDADIKAKSSYLGGEVGMTPLKLAKELGKRCVRQLEMWPKEGQTSQMELTFIELGSQDDSIVSDPTLYSYFYLAAAFLPPDQIKKLDLEGENFAGMCKKMYGLLTREEKAVKESVARCVRPFVNDIADQIEKGSKFQVEMVNTYTKPFFFNHVNAALRRAAFVVQRKLKDDTFQASPPSGDDLTLSMYALFLQTVLLYWDNLPKVTEPTYRGVSLSKEEVKKYQPGSVICWLPFSSSSLKEDKAIYFAKKDILLSGKQPVVFEINNERISIWSPRDISKFSTDEREKEVLHPCGTKFVVKGKWERDGFDWFQIELVQHFQCEL